MNPEESPSTMRAQKTPVKLTPISGMREAGTPGTENPGSARRTRQSGRKLAAHQIHVTAPESRNEVIKILVAVPDQYAGLTRSAAPAAPPIN